MAIKKQKESSFITILLQIALIVVPAIATTNIDCKGKAFHCVNSTHFKICVDFGGVSKTVDDFLIPCPPSTECTDNNYYECEFQIPTTSATLDVQSDVTNELSESYVSSPWELFEVTTFFPLNNNERSIELSENSNITPPDTVLEAAGHETTDIRNYSLVNEVQNEVITENILYKTTVSDLSESDTNNSKYDDVITSTKITAVNGILDYLNTTISYAPVNVDNYSTTERVISGDIKTTSLNNFEEPGFVATTLFSRVITDKLNTNKTPEKVTTQNNINTKSEIAIDLYEPVTTTFKNNIENEDLLSTITDNNLSPNRTIEKATTEGYTSTKSEIAIDLYEPVITTLMNNLENKNLPSILSDSINTNETSEKATIEKYTGTKTEIFVDLYEPVTTTVTNKIENEDLPSTITDNLSTNKSPEITTTKKYTSTKSEIAIDLYEPVITTLTNNIKYEDLPSIIIDNLSTNRRTEEATTEKYTSAKSEIAIDVYEPVITTLTNKIENEDLPSTITDHLSPNRTTEKATIEEYTSTKSDIAFDLWEPVITTLTYNLENENLPLIITDNSSTIRTPEITTTEKYTSTNSEIAVDSYKPIITTLTNKIENDDLPATITDNLSTNKSPEITTTEKYTSTKSEIAIDLYEPVITTLTNNIENENLPSIITDNLSTNRRTEEATTEKYTSAKSEIAIDVHEPVITTLTNNEENENLLSTITDNLSPNRTTEKATIEEYTSTKSEIALDLWEPVITTLTYNLENENLPSIITDKLSTIRTPEITTTEKYTSTNSEITVDSYEPIITTLTNNIENEDLPSTITDNLSTNKSPEIATTEKYTSTKSEIAIDLYEPVITILTNDVENENLSSTIIDNLSTNKIAEEITGKYTSTKSEIAIDYESVIATRMNNIEKQDFHSTTLLSAIDKNINTNISPAAVTTPNYSGNNSEILTTTSNYLDNTYFIATTLYPPVINKKFTNKENSEINSTGTSDAYLVSTQNITAKDVDLPTSTHAYIFYTNTVTKNSNERADDSFMQANGTYMNKIDEISSYSKIADSIQTESPMITENIALNNTLERYSIKEQKDFSVTRTDSLNIENIFKSDSTDSTKNTAENKQQDMTAKDFNQPTTQASIFAKKDSNDKENIYSAESNSNTKNMINSSADVITFPVRSDLVNVKQDMAEKDINSPTTIIDSYRNAAMKSSKVDNISMYETPTSNADLPFTPGSDKQLQLRTDVNLTLKNTTEEISAKKQNDIYLQISEDHSFSENNNETLATKSAISVIDSTNSYELNLSIANEIEVHTNTTKITSNDTAEEILTHKKDILKNEISDTSPLPLNVDFIITSFLTTNSDEISLTTVDLDLNDQVEEFLTKENYHLPLSVNSESSLVTEIIMKNLSLSDLIVTTEPYIANSQQNMTVANLQLSTSSLTDETIEYQPNNQNSKVTETLTHEFFATTDEYGSKQNLTKQRYDYDDNSSSIFTASMFTSFAKPEHNVKLKDSFPNQTTKPTTNIDKNLSKIKVKSNDSLSSEIDSKEILNNNMVKEISRNNSDNNMHSSQNNPVYSFNLFNSTNMEYGLTISKNSSKVATNIGNLDNGTVSKNILTPLILSANIYKEIKTTNDESTRNSVKSGGLNKHDSSDNLVPFSNQHFQNKLLSRNESMPLHSKMNIVLIQDLHNKNRFQINALQNVFDNTSNSFYKPITISQNITNRPKVMNSTYNNENKSITFNSTQIKSTFEDNLKNSASNIYSTRISKNKTSENLSRNYQNNSNYKMISNKTRIDVTDINEWSINKNKQINITANQDKINKQNNKTTKIAAKDQLNNSNSSKDYERTIIKFDCKNRHRGKYSDTNDCQKFYICIGRSEPILGKCPINTVFSEITKQCTKNLSHCIRNNQFQCPSTGRYIDIFSDQFYFICAKNVEGYIRFKLKCQKGYHLDKSKLQCTLDSLNESLSNEDISETDREKITIESISKEKNDSKHQKNDFVLKCQKGYHLDKSKLQCILDSLNRSMSNEEISKTDSEKSTTESKSKEERDSKNLKNNFECKTEGKFVYPDDFRKYYQCTKIRKSEFRRKIKKCDSDEIFHSEKRKCVGDDSYDSNE